MLEDLNRIVRMGIEEIISSAHSLTLLKLYSVLYLSGGQPRSCEASQRRYFQQIKKDYIMNKEKLQRTCVPKFEGRKYIPGVFKDGKLVAGHLHISGKLLTDKQAAELLKVGALKESDFHRLPGEEPKAPKEYTSDEIIDALGRNDYKEMSGIARELGLISGTVKSEVVASALNDYLIDLED